MIIENVDQGSEKWEALRRGVPTASDFNRIVTPVKCQLSASSVNYAIELIAELKTTVVPMLPTVWMDHGKEHEGYAVAAYESIEGVTTQQVGFVWRDERKLYGCSPDRFVGDDGLLEVKCPKPETLIGYHLENALPKEYKPQVMGQLLITGREWCDFFAWHPELTHFSIRVERDEEYIANLAVALEEFCEQLESLKKRLGNIYEPVVVQMNDDYQEITYESSEVQL